jgi:hypothetical protein
MSPITMCFLRFGVSFYFIEYCYFLFPLLKNHNYFTLLFHFFAYFSRSIFAMPGLFLISKERFCIVLSTGRSNNFKFLHYPLFTFWTSCRISTPKRPVNFICC